MKTLLQIVVLMEMVCFTPPWKSFKNLEEYTSAATNSSNPGRHFQAITYNTLGARSTTYDIECKILIFHVIWEWLKACTDIENSLVDARFGLMGLNNVVRLTMPAVHWFLSRTSKNGNAWIFLELQISILIWVAAIHYTTRRPWRFLPLICFLLKSFK